MKHLFYLLFLNLFISCTSHAQDYETLQKIHLGKNSKIFSTYLDSLNIPKDEFYNGDAYMALAVDIDDVDNKIFTTYFSDIFDYPEYIGFNGKVHHPSILSAIEKNGKIHQINYHLGSTDDALLIYNNDFVNITEVTGIKSFRQIISKEIIQKIESYLIEKYGIPKREKNLDIPLQILQQGKFITSYLDGHPLTTEVLTWETKFITITFYKGVEFKHVLYNKSGRHYSYGLEELNEDKLFKYTKIFSRIEFTLK